MTRPTGKSTARARLSAEADRIVRREIALHGYTGAATRLGLTPSVLDRLADGGAGLPETVKRAEAAIAAFEARRVRRLAS